MITVMATVIISIATSLVVAALVTILGCYGFKVYIEREINRILDEEGLRTEKHVLEMINLAKKSIRNTHLNK